MTKTAEINIRVFPDRGSVLVSIECGLLITPGAVVNLLENAVRELKVLYPETQTSEDRVASQYLLNNENPQRQ